MSETNHKRNAALAAYYAKGNSIREVAVKFNITLQRAHQILARDYPNLIRAVGDTRNNSTGLTSSERAAQ